MHIQVGSCWVSCVPLPDFIETTTLMVVQLCRGHQVVGAAVRPPLHVLKLLVSPGGAVTAS